MDIGAPIAEFGPVEIAALRDGMATLSEADWARDHASRARFAGERAGDAIYFYNDEPSFAGKHSLAEAAETGLVHVLRNAGYPMFAEIDRIVMAAAERFPDCDVLRVQLARLPAGAQIGRHRDGTILAQIHRLHVPIATNGGVVFEIGEGTFHLAEGELYELNNVVPHAVRNDGASDRVHLLVDLMPHRLARAVYFDSARELAAAVIGAQAQRLVRR